MEKTFDPAELSKFTGSETVTRHSLIRRIVYSEGAQYVADSAGAYWFIDEIVFGQTLRKIQAEEFQVWNLKVTGSKAVITVEDGNDNVVFIKHIDFTNFPAPGVTLWFENNTIYLPSER
jgi:hypothetical protein